MKLIPLFLLLLTPLTALATGNAESQVLAAEQARGQALVSADREVLDALLSDDLRYVHSSGRIQSKADVMAGFADGGLAYDLFELSDLLARQIAPEVVVVNGQIDQRKKSRGQWKRLTLLFQSVWRHEATGWRMVALQTVLPPAPKS